MAEIAKYIVAIYSCGDSRRIALRSLLIPEFPETKVLQIYRIKTGYSIFLIKNAA
jgi:hypothetical protein